MHLLDGLFGDTEPSKALAAFICIFINELKGQDDALGLTKRFGKIYALGMVTKAMTAYCCLQYLNRRRWKEMVKLKLLYRTVFPKSKDIYDPSAPVKLTGMFSDQSPQAETKRVLSRVASVDYLSLAHCVHLGKFDDALVIDHNVKFNPTRKARKRFHSGPDKAPQQSFSRIPSESNSQKTLLDTNFCPMESQSSSLPIFEKASRYVKFAVAAYGPNFLKLMGMEKPRQSRFAAEDELHHHYSLANHTDIPVENILASSHDALATLHAPQLIAPVHYVIVDSATNCIVVSLRGTLGLSDIMTDLIASYDPFTYDEADGYVHSGIYHSAKALSEGYIKDAVIEALQKNPDYNLVLTGHSLGGGCAALLTLIWSKRVIDGDGNVSFYTNTTLGFPARKINAFVYACPAIMSSHLSQFVCGLITTVIYRNFC